MAKSPSMTRMTWPQAVELLDATRAGLHHLDPKVDEALGEARELYQVHLQDDERFLSLTWPEADGSRLLTPTDEGRTLGEVAARLLVNKWTFEKLTADLGLSPVEHDPDYFGKCRYMDDEFDYERFGTLMLAPVTDEEREQSPEGSFFIFDGVHRCLTLAKRLLAQEEDYRQVPALLMIPRPGLPAG